MPFTRRRFALALACLALSGPLAQAASAPNSKALWLAAQLDSMGVEGKWIAGAHVNWRTGMPDDVTETLPGRHTHCSAFVAAAAMKVGVHILRPPEHGQVLLANAQNEWLGGDVAASEGWTALAGPAEAQQAANVGALVVASYHNHHDDKPGHIAIVRPGVKTAAQIAADGPDVIQAGTVNANSIAIRLGFAGHVHAWGGNEIEYFAHDVAGPGGG